MLGSAVVACLPLSHTRGARGEEGEGESGGAEQGVEVEEVGVQERGAGMVAVVGRSCRAVRLAATRESDRRMEVQVWCRRCNKRCRPALGVHLQGRGVGVVGG